MLKNGNESTLKNYFKYLKRLKLTHSLNYSIHQYNNTQ